MGKLKYIGLVSLAIFLGIGGAFFWNVFFESKNVGVGMSVTYKSLDEMYRDSQIILEGKVSSEFEEVETIRGDQVTKDRLYKVTVEKVLVNSTDSQLQKGDNITLSHTMGYERNGIFYYVLDEHNIDINTGTYVLFLNKYYDNVLGIETFVNNSPNHLYLLEGTKFKNVAGKVLEEFSVVDITAVIEKHKNQK